MLESQEKNAYRRLTYRLEQHRSGVRRMSRSEFRKCKREIARYKDREAARNDDLWAEWARVKRGHMSSWWHSGENRFGG